MPLQNHSTCLKAVISPHFCTLSKSHTPSISNSEPAQIVQSIPSSSIQTPIPNPNPPSPPPKMQLRPLLTALLAATAFSPPTIQSQSSTDHPTLNTYCVPIPRRHTSAPILPRMRRPRPDAISLSPPPLSNPSTSTTNVSKDTNASSNPLHALPPPPAWVLTLEDLITAIFRVVMTILTLFNVNITWRIRGEWHRRAAHKCTCRQS